MPKAPGDYQLRYPIDFGDIDPSIRQWPVQLYAADFGKSRGILYMPATDKPRTVVIMAHPRADFSTHYSIPYWIGAGFAAFGFNTRYLNNDAMMLHENLLLDLAAGIRFLREEAGFEKIVMLGNSGGGSLFAYYDSQARTPAGKRVTTPPGGGPPDLNKFDLQTADGYIALAAHPGQGMVLMSCLDAAVVDESDPLASDPALDMYDERNGFKTPPAESRYAKDFIERYRAAQLARCARIDAIARRHIAEASHGRAAMRAPDFAASSADNRNYFGAACNGADVHGRVSHASKPQLSRLVDRSVGARAPDRSSRRVPISQTTRRSALAESLRPMRGCRPGRDFHRTRRWRQTCQR